MKNKYKAETILEVIIAVAVIMVILAPASALYIASIRTAAVNRNDLVAAALAEEGIEIMRNIRDTNFIKFSNQARDCWNTVLGELPPGTNCADAPNKIAEGSYRLNINPATLQWSLVGPVAIGSDDVLSNNLSGGHDEDYRLYSDASSAPECTSPGDPPGCHVHFMDDTHLYFHGGAAANVSSFYREVTISSIDLTADGVNNDAMKIISRVLYRTGIAVRTIERVAFLTREPS